MMRDLPRFLYLVYAIGRILTQSCQLFYHLLLARRKLGKFDYILVQNPPGIPLLMVTALVRFLTWLPSCCRRRKAWTKVVIDWHNYGWTILQVNRANRLFVRLAKVFELTFGRFADYHLTVSEAMKRNLA